MKIKTKILAALVLLMLMFGSTAFALEAFGLNTVAGSSTVLRTSKTSPNADLAFVVRKPDGRTMDVEAKTNANGVAIKDLSDYYTKLAGTYAVAVKGVDGLVGNFRSFDVYANVVSDVDSVLTPSDQVVNIPSERANLKVRLLDEYKNPVPGHAVKLISSSRNSSVKLLSETAKTDEDGEISFEVTSSEPGKVTYSAYDATEDLVLSSKARIVYFSSGASAVGAQLFTSTLGDIGTSSGPVDKFEFEDVPASVTVGESISLKLVAQDSFGQTATNYTGTVRFAVTSSNSSYANLPADYKFTLQDQGEHTFSLAFSFTNPGVYNLAVRDLTNTAVSGELTLDVKAGSGSTGSNTSGIIITNPSQGGTYSNNIQVITGTAPAGANLKIFNNDLKIGDLVVDSSGSFTFTTGLLADGDHKMYVASVNEVGTIIATGPTVDFSINTKAAEIVQVSVEPSGAVSPGQIVKISLTPTEALSRASVTLNNNVYDLTKNQNGVYEVSLPAPIEFGEYKLDFVLVDELGNESTFKEQTVLKVGQGGPDATAEKPGVVPNLTLTPGDGKVTLNWMPPSTGSPDVQNYRVFYGISPNQLINAVDTFTNATTWYVPNLVNGTTYYFSVAAIDTKGGMSESFDKILAATPNPAVIEVVPPEIELGIGGSEALEDMEKDASESGPEVLWLVLVAALGGIFYSESAKRRHRSGC